MKIIHHRLEDGMAEPIEIIFESKAKLLFYVEDAMDFGDFRPINDYDKELHPSKVFLLTHGSDDSSITGEIYVSNNPCHTFNVLDLWLTEFEKSMDLSVIHLQEFASFEQAYEVATYMREGHPLAS